MINPEFDEVKSILFDADYHDDVIELDRDERIYQAALSLSAAGLKLFPCSAYDPVKLDRCRDVISNSTNEEEVRRAEEALFYASGKAPGIKQPYGKNGQGKASSDPEQITNWFHPVSGDFRGRNIGIATGEQSNLIAVDLDVSDEANGLDWWVEQQAIHGQVDTVMVRSGGKSNKGMHIYFRYREGISTTKHVNGIPGVDTRSNGGHVLAPLSECNNIYQVISVSGQIAEMPEWLFEQISKRQRGSTNKVTTLPGVNENIGNGRERERCPLWLIEDALRSMDVNDFEGNDRWREVGMAISSEWPDEEGWAIFDRWSSGDYSESGEPYGYNKEKNRIRWASFSGQGDGLINIGTLHRMAEEEFGWVDPRRGVEVMDMGRAMLMMRESFVMVDPSKWEATQRRRGLTDFGPGPVARVPTGTIYFTGVPVIPGNTDWRKKGIRRVRPEEVVIEQVSDISATYAVDAGIGRDGKSKTMPISAAWKRSPAKNVVRGVGYYVARDRVPAGVLNLFTGWGVKPKEGDPKMFRKHLLEIICSGDEEKYSWIINRLAYMIQYGEVNIPSSLVIHGAEGLGKGIFSDYIQKVVGQDNFHYTADPETFTGRFSEELVGKFFVVSDEALFSGDVKADNKAKGLIGNAVMRDEAKFKSAKNSQNVSFIVFFSNHEDPVMVTRGNRRYSVMKGNDKYSNIKMEADPAVAKEARQHFKELGEEMNGDGPSNLLHLLINHKVDKNLARYGLMTEEKASMAQRQDAKKDSLSEWLIYLLANEPTDSSGRWNTHTKAGAIYDEYNAWVRDNKHNHASRGWNALNVTAFSHQLTGKGDKENYGFTPKRRSDGNAYLWPTRKLLHTILQERYSFIVEGPYDGDDEIIEMPSEF